MENIPIFQFNAVRTLSELYIVLVKEKSRYYFTGFSKQNVIVTLDLSQVSSKNTKNRFSNRKWRRAR